MSNNNKAVLTDEQIDDICFEEIGMRTSNDHELKRFSRAIESAVLAAVDSQSQEEILSLHRQLAAEKLRADQGWQRAEAKSKECIELRERMAAVDKQGMACAWEPLVFDDFPEFNAHAMGCGLEDRGITDRYEAMRYGFEEALDLVDERIKNFLADFAAPFASQSEGEQA